MTYKQLQSEASELGMKSVVGKSKEDLIAFIEKNGEVRAEEIETPQPTKENEPEYNLATVFDGAREVRRYDLNTHGERFVLLAEEFAINRGYSVQLGFLAGKIECPNCGNKFNL